MQRIIQVGTDKILSLWDLRGMYFLAFEGLDGSGKSSLMVRLESELKNRRLDFIRTREPGGTSLGERLRDMILEKSSCPPFPRAELLMYEASRAQHVDELIQPALKSGKWVLTDRFSASSLAFQGAARGMGWEIVSQLNQFATDGLSPHLNVLLDLSVEESRKRRGVRESQLGVQADRIESENEEFHQKVREGFLKAASQKPEEWLVLEASKSTEELYLILMKELVRRKWLL